MNIILEVFNYSFIAVLIGVTATWIFLLKSMLKSFSCTPYLDKFEKKVGTHDTSSTPKVSIILPARNEEKYIAKCLESLVKQDYQNYEIIAIDDSSTDNTRKIIAEYANKNSKIIPVNAKEKPDGWMGKNWACMQGYSKATGQLLLFTDSDTVHAANVITLAVTHLRSLNLDALTAIPKMLSLDFWTRVTLPMISTFLHTRFSALRVNDPTKKTGYFFGSFFIIKKEVYDAVGTHKGVKQEVIEDGALGKKVKESGYKMRMVRAEHLIDAVWARDGKTLWNALKRLMVPLYLQNGAIATGIFFAVLFLLFMPFPVLVYSIATFDDTSTSSVLLTVISAMSAILIYAGAVIESRMGLYIKLGYTTVLTPIGGLVVVAGFLSGLIQAKRDAAVSWRGRVYTMRDHAQNPVNI